MTESPRDLVLVHGLWMVPASMLPLAWRLRRRGFAPHRFGYPSRHASLADHAVRLDAWLTDRFGPPPTDPGLAFVGHSLGGLVLRALAAREPRWFEGGRTVLLGSPNRGSSGARLFMGHWLGRWWLGQAGQELGQGVPDRLPATPGKVGVLAGTRERPGTRRILGGPNDGMVALAETPLPRAEVRALPVGHIGLIFRRPAAEAVAHFLREGDFGSHGEPVLE